MPYFNVLVLGCLAVIISMLVLIAVLLNKGTSVRVRVELDDQLDKIRQATEHYTDVSAVVTMMSQIGDLDEDAEQLLMSYPRSMRAAVWLHYMNTLASNSMVAQTSLSNAHTGTDNFYRFPGVSDQNQLITERQQHVDNLHAKLDAAITGSKQLSL